MLESVIPDTEPCLVKTRQGFSVLYKNRYLYSRYAPDKTVLQLINTTTILPDTLVLCYSPLLCYGLPELIAKLPEHCFVLCIEHDPVLHEFSLKHGKKDIADTDTIAMLQLDRPEQITNALSDRIFKRCIPLDMSGGTALSPDFYREVTRYADDSIGTFWKNRITLTRLGKLYSTNLLTNCAAIPNAVPLKRASVHRPILVLGAGPSVDSLLSTLREYSDNLYILCVDAALPALLQHGITPSAAVAVESQLAIEKAYIGCSGKNIHLFADLTSRSNVLSLLDGPISFFLSEYCNEPFFTRFKELTANQSIPVLPPLGSVGLVALELALELRGSNVPVFFTGLDFSYSAGMTHCKGAPAHTAALCTAGRLLPAGNPAAAYSAGTYSFTGKNGRLEFTTPSLSSYGTILSVRYAHTPLLFDCGSSGMITGIPQIQQNDFTALLKKCLTTQKKGPATHSDCENAYSNDEHKKNVCKAFLEQEKSSLVKIQELLTSERNSEKEELKSLLETHGYLYLHFPDAVCGPRLEPDFLKRLSVELHYYLKKISTAIRLLS